MGSDRFSKYWRLTLPVRNPLIGERICVHGPKGILCLIRLTYTPTQLISIPYISSVLLILLFNQSECRNMMRNSTSHNIGLICFLAVCCRSWRRALKTSISKTRSRKFLLKPDYTDGPADHITAYCCGTRQLSVVAITSKT